MPQISLSSFVDHEYNLTTPPKMDLLRIRLVGNRIRERPRIDLYVLLSIQAAGSPIITVAPNPSQAMPGTRVFVGDLSIEVIF